MFPTYLLSTKSEFFINVSRLLHRTHFQGQCADRIFPRRNKNSMWMDFMSRIDIGMTSGNSSALSSADGNELSLIVWGLFNLNCQTPLASLHGTKINNILKDIRAVSTFIWWHIRRSLMEISAPQFFYAQLT